MRTAFKSTPVRIYAPLRTRSLRQTQRHDAATDVNSNTHTSNFSSPSFAASGKSEPTRAQLAPRGGRLHALPRHRRVIASERDAWRSQEELLCVHCVVLMGNGAGSPGLGYGRGLEARCVCIFLCAWSVCALLTRWRKQWAKSITTPTGLRRP